MRSHELLTADPDRFTQMHIDFGDGPNDFSDAYVITGHLDGEEMDEEEIEYLNTQCRETLFHIMEANYY